MTRLFPMFIYSHAVVTETLPGIHSCLAHPERAMYYTWFWGSSSRQGRAGICLYRAHHLPENNPKDGKKGQDQGGHDRVSHQDSSLSWKDKEEIPEEMTLKERLEEDLGVGIPHCILLANRVSLLRKGLNKHWTEAWILQVILLITLGTPGRESWVPTACPPLQRNFFKFQIPL